MMFKRKGGGGQRPFEQCSKKLHFSYPMASLITQRTCEVLLTVFPRPSALQRICCKFPGNRNSPYQAAYHRHMFFISQIYVKRAFEKVKIWWGDTDPSHTHTQTTEYSATRFV